MEYWLVYTAARLCTQNWQPKIVKQQDHLQAMENTIKPVELQERAAQTVMLSVLYRRRCNTLILSLVQLASTESREAHRLSNRRGIPVM